MATTVLALFESAQAAQDAAKALEQEGYLRADISVESYSGGTQEAAQVHESGWERLLEKLHLSVPKEHTDYYSQGMTSGQTLVSVDTTDETADGAIEILSSCGAVDLDERTSQFHAGQGTVSAATTQAADQKVIPLVEESLAVGKRQVERGGVRVYQRVTERPVEETVTLQEEHVTLDRRPVDRPVTDAETAFQERSYEVTTTGEVPVVAKEARVVEEVAIGKTAEEHTETVRDTVRRTDVEVEQLDEEDVRSTAR